MTDTTSCGCGSPTAVAMAPGERIVHRQDGPCFIEQTGAPRLAVTGSPAVTDPVRSQAAKDEGVLNEILVELRRIGDGIDSLRGANRATRKGHA